jgi:hypothetical protein
MCLRHRRMLMLRIQSIFSNGGCGRYLHHHCIDSLAMEKQGGRTIQAGTIIVYLEEPIVCLIVSRMRTVIQRVLILSLSTGVWTALFTVITVRASYFVHDREPEKNVNGVDARLSRYANLRGALLHSVSPVLQYRPRNLERAAGDRTHRLRFAHGLAGHGVD